MTRPRSHTATRLRRLLAVVSAAMLSLMVGQLPANAQPVLVSQLSFSPANPTYDPYGSSTSIWGQAAVTSGGWLDFSGRAVVQTPNRANLNPGTADFTFGARIALTRGVANANIMQKGFWNDRQWKLSVHAKNGAAQFSCRVSGSAGAVHVFTNGPVISTGSTWHEVACRRSGTKVQVLLDGAVIATKSGATGSVSSSNQYTIGSKGAGNISDPDQYRGLLDDAFVQVGS